jgi:glycerophosphoryl diester phosphodiesterase
MKLAGKDIKVWDATLEEMQGIDVGSWFNPSFSSEHVPTLRQVLAESKGRANVVIELKYYGHDEQLEQRVIDIVEDMDMVEQTAIMSLKYSAVQKMRKLRPDWHVGLLSATAIGDLTQLDADFLAVAMGMASGGFVRRAHEAGKQVFVWTVNDPVSMSRMMSLGVDGIITDEPAMARQVLADRKEMSTAERLLLHTALLFGQSFTPKEYRDESP